MHLLGKKRYESNRISYLSMPSKQKQSNKIKTQPIDASKFATRVGFKTQGKVASQTRYTDKNQSSPQIMIRKLHDKQKKIHSPSDLHFSYKNLTQRTQRQTQRQKFMKELKVRVLRNEEISVHEEETLVQEQRGKQLTARYQNDNQILKLGKSRAKSNSSFDDLTSRQLMKLRKDSCEGSIVNIKSANGDGEDDIQLRDRAKTFAKDFSKIVEQNLNFKQKTCNQNQSKTIEANDIENKIHRSQSIVIFDNPSKNTSPTYQIASKQLIKSQLLGRNVGNVSAQDSSRQDSLYPNNTEKYEQEVQQITKEFLSDWQKMNTTKSQLYQKFRNKLVKQFPKMRKKYKKNELGPAQEASKKMSSSMITPGLQSSIKVSFNNQNNQDTQINYLTVTQLKEQSQKLEKNYEEKWKEQQRRTLKQIFKQAHFYSRTKNKCLSVKYQKSEEQIQHQRKIRNIQKNMTFMSYINKKEGKLNVGTNKHFRGDNIIKNKQSILQLQKEGSPQQQYLLKCLDNAIEDCMKA